MRAWVLSVALAAGSLGLVGGPVAEAACAGPQLQVWPAAFSPVPPDSSDPTAEPTWAVRAGERIIVEARHLGPCRDTPTQSAPGCGRDRIESVDQAGPVPRVTLILEQGSRRWDLGAADARPPAYAVDFVVDLPRGLAPGRARLRLTNPVEGEGTLALQVS